MDVFLWNGFGNYDDSEKSLYFADHNLNKKQQFDFRNKHLIYYPKLFDYLQDCKEVDSSTLFCAYQSAVPFKGKSCKQVIKEQGKSPTVAFEDWNLLTRVPVEQWELHFFTLQVLDFDEFAYQVKELKEDDFKQWDQSTIKWKNSHQINPKQYIRCDAED